jgi:alkylated DNA nucleotide flippase Atl1
MSGRLPGISGKTKRMVAENDDLITYSPSKRIYEAVKKIPKGRVAVKYAFGGALKQAEILESEGVTVVDGKVDLEKYRFI